MNRMPRNKPGIAGSSAPSRSLGPRQSRTAAQRSGTRSRLQRSTHGSSRSRLARRSAGRCACERASACPAGARRVPSVCARSRASHAAQVHFHAGGEPEQIEAVRAPLEERRVREVHHACDVLHPAVISRPFRRHTPAGLPQKGSEVKASTWESRIDMGGSLVASVSRRCQIRDHCIQRRRRQVGRRWPREQKSATGHDNGHCKSDDTAPVHARIPFTRGRC